MSRDEPGGRPGSVLEGLLAPLRLPERVLNTLTGAARDVGLIRSEVTRVREQTEPLDGLLPALERLERGLEARLDALGEVVGALENEESFLNKSVMQLARELGALHKTVAALQDDLQRVTEHLPDGRGPLQAVRNAFTSDGD